ncbi:hypothetical protein RHCRD62_40134 [Rhodococcus sp. RD6.2]|nr:hypothetical protein RHCRD62_40134 [Rhodococcus sp. RD6.2]
MTGREGQVQVQVQRPTGRTHAIGLGDGRSELVGRAWNGVRVRPRTSSSIQAYFVVP